MGTSHSYSFSPRIRDEYAHIKYPRIGHALQRYHARHYGCDVLVYKSFQLVFEVGVFERQCLYHYELFQSQSYNHNHNHIDNLNDNLNDHGNVNRNNNHHKANHDDNDDNVGKITTNNNVNHIHKDDVQREGISGLEVLSCLYLLGDIYVVSIDYKFDALIALMQFNPVPDLIVNTFSYNAPEKIVLFDQVMLMLQSAIFGLIRLTSNNDNTNKQQPHGYHRQLASTSSKATATTSSSSTSSSTSTMFPSNEIIKGIVDQVFIVDDESVTKLPWNYAKSRLLSSRLICSFLNQFFPVLHIPTLFEDLEKKCFEFETKVSLILDVHKDYREIGRSHDHNDIVDIDGMHDENVHEITVVEAGSFDHFEQGIQEIRDKVELSTSFEAVGDTMEAKQDEKLMLAPSKPPSAIGNSRGSMTRPLSGVEASNAITSELQQGLTPLPPSESIPSSRFSRPQSRAFIIPQSRPDSSLPIYALGNFHEFADLHVAPPRFGSAKEKMIFPVPGQPLKQTYFDLLMQSLGSFGARYRLDHKEIHFLEDHLAKAADKNDRALFSYIARNIFAFNIVSGITTHHNYIMLSQIEPLIRLCADSQNWKEILCLEIETMASEIQRYIATRLEEQEEKGTIRPPASKTRVISSADNSAVPRKISSTGDQYNAMVSRLAWLEIRLMPHIAAFHLLSSDSVDDEDRDVTSPTTNKLIAFWNELLTKPGPGELLYLPDVLMYFKATTWYKIRRSMLAVASLRGTTISISEGADHFDNMVAARPEQADTIFSNIQFAVDDIIRTCMRHRNKKLVSKEPSTSSKMSQKIGEIDGLAAASEFGMTAELLRLHRSYIDKALDQLSTYIAGLLAL